MKGKHRAKRVNPTVMITTVTQIFKPNLKKPALKNLILTVIAIALAKTFRINEIASRLPVSVKSLKTKQKRLLRFLDSVFPIDAVMRHGLVFVLKSVCQNRKTRTLILIDETKLIGGFRSSASVQLPVVSKCFCQSLATGHWDVCFSDPMYLISNHLNGVEIHRCYKRRMQIEHGFRDIKSCFGFGSLVLKKPTQSRINLLWLLAVLTYGLLFIVISVHIYTRRNRLIDNRG